MGGEAMALRQCLEDTAQYAGTCQEHDEQDVQLNTTEKVRIKLCWCNDEDGCNGAYRVSPLYYFMFVVLPGILMTILPINI